MNVQLMSNIAESERADEKYIKCLVGDPEGKRKLARTGKSRENKLYGMKCVYYFSTWSVSQYLASMIAQFLNNELSQFWEKSPVV